MNTRDIVISEIEKNRDLYIRTASNIWDYAETAFAEFRSSEEIASVLKENGFDVEMGCAEMDTAFIAQWGSGEPILGFLGEYDALPDLSQRAESIVIDPLIPGNPGHGCGHHILGTGAMAAAIAVKRTMQEKGIPGTIRFYGCPAEEGGGGKLYMARNGLFNDLACAITWHPADDNMIWSMNFMAVEGLRVRFRGISAHAPSQVHLGRSALCASELMNIGVNYLRGQVLRDVCINYAYLDAGGPAPNVIPNHSEEVFNIRASTHQRARETAQRVEQIARGAAMMMECSVEVEYTGGLSELVPNRTIERIAYDEYKYVGPTPITEEDRDFCEKMHKAFPDTAENSTFSTLEYWYGEDAAPLIEGIRGKVINDVLYPYKEINISKYGSTDVCDVSWFTPTLQLTAACYAKDTPGHSWQQVAQGKRPLCFNGMMTAAKVMALTAIRLLEEPALISDIRNEFGQKMNGKQYECPIAPDRHPPKRK